MHSYDKVRWNRWWRWRRWQRMTTQQMKIMLKCCDLSTWKRAKELQRKMWVDRVRELCEIACIASRWWWWWIGIDVAATKRHFATAFAIVGAVATSCIQSLSFELITWSWTPKSRRELWTCNLSAVSVPVRTCTWDCPWCNFRHWHCRL